MLRSRWLLLGAILLCALPATAEAARRKVPIGFYGVTYDRELARAPASLQDLQWRVMSRAGVETARVNFSWAYAEPRPGQFNFGGLDSVVARAARARIQLLPVIPDAPTWARIYPSRPGSPPADPDDYAHYMRVLVQRYGPGGAFWRSRPDLPQRPVRTWQIWNEPHLRYFWDVGRGDSAAFPAGYVDLLEAAYRAVKGSDRGARIVLAGLANDSWRILQRLYDEGAAPWFDVVALHPYTETPGHTLRVIKLARRVINENDSHRKPIWLTEFGWPATPPRFRGASSRMARRLRDGYGLVIRYRRRYGIRRSYWYTWASSYANEPVYPAFAFSGLQRYRGLGFRRMPAFWAYVHSAQRAEGCIKASDGRCRRRR